MPKPKQKKTSPPKTELEQLRAVWYKKLKDSGFEDAERDEDSLKVYSTSNHHRMRQRDWQSYAQYYSMATKFLHDYKFESKFDHTIWMYHSEGLSNVEVSKIIRKVYHKRATGRDVVSRTVLRIRKSMFAMYILPQGEYRE